jgi:hypothetical protein
VVQERAEGPKAPSPGRVGLNLQNLNNSILFVFNATRTLPEVGSDLAQEITRDPYNFAFTGITKPYNERILKDALLNNITKFLTELGTGFAYVGKEYRLQIGEKENFIDLLFYNLNLSLLMPSTIRKCLNIINEMVSSSCFRQMRKNGPFCITKV